MMQLSKITTWSLGTLIAAGVIALVVLLVGSLRGQETESKETAQTEFAQVMERDDLKAAYFAGGCFWCTEAVFEELDGVEAVLSGYAGGPEENPSYKEVAYGRTGHTETIAVFYDPEKITYEKLLEWFWKAHDPTQVNRQGPDVGTQYRSAIFYTDPAEKELIEKSKAEAAKMFDDPIATEIEELERFWPAEDYHQDFADKNPNHPYLRQWLDPKLKKLDLE